MMNQAELVWMHEYWLRRTEAPSAADRTTTIVLILLLPIFAAFIQSAWIWFVRGTESYQAMLHWLNHPGQPTWIVLAIQAVVDGVALWPLVRLQRLQRGAAL